MIICKSPRELEHMRRAGKIVARAIKELEAVIRPGIRTRELDKVAERCIRTMGAIPAFKGYRGFPASICVAVNEEVVHGIPGERVLVEGDIVSIDIGAVADGYYGDAAVTFPVGEVSEEAERLITLTKESLYAGIKEARPGGRVGDISKAIQSYVEKHNLSVVRAFVGHGIGREMHEEPQVPNFFDPGSGPGPVLKCGMTLAIEPMVNAGGSEVLIKNDNWTVVTRDSSLSAHFEHTVAITSSDPEILTIL